jgi:hypothetical protein
MRKLKTIGAAALTAVTLAVGGLVTAPTASAAAIALSARALAVPAQAADARAPITGSFVARLGATDSYAGIVVGQGKVLAYVCNGTDAAAPTVYSWFKGRVRNGKAELTANGLRLGIRLARNRGSGNLRLPDGTKTTFRLRAATGSAGLYRARKRKNGRVFTAGWVLLSRRAQRGAVGIVDGTSNTAVQAPRLDPDQSSVTLPGVGETPVKKLTFISRDDGDD